ncbi:hypothetical protein IGI04_015108 [Brassica rapa subsp. trilocularis]|uniref:MADS-box domain-containing protein n=1 Tax=Brassica rapa subsp. trilocularis TaxID=1813537 RepID=A0ABQ7MP41_BRACM|nr:hypothetical protein IGI04_015108 [Brassica rapa subsp. trilocularis]
MVKGGTKRKATMERITKRESAATTFTKRSYGLHSKVSQLCLLTDAQIAVLATPPSSNSNVSFFSFGHSSVDSIVTAFLTGERTAVREARIEDHEDLGICLARKELGLPQWWEDDALLKSKSPQELSLAINSMSTLLSKINELRAEDAKAEPPLKKQKKKKNEETMKKTEPTVEQTLVLPSGSSDRTLDYNNNNVRTEEELDQIMSTCDSFGLPHNNNSNDSLEEIDFDQLIDLDLDFDFDSDKNETMKMTEPLDQPLLLPYDSCASPDNNNTYSTGEMSLDYGIDTSSVFVDDSLLESAMNCVPSVDGFVETITTTQEQLQEETTIALNSGIDQTQTAHLQFLD